MNGLNAYPVLNQIALPYRQAGSVVNYWSLEWRLSDDSDGLNQQQSRNDQQSRNKIKTSHNLSFRPSR